MTRNEARIPFFLLWRHIRRGNVWTILLIVFLMAIAFINLIFVTSLFQGIIDGTNKQIINVATSHIVVTPSNASGFFLDQEQIVANALTDPDVVATSTRSEFPARFTHGDRRGSWSVVAIDPTAEQRVLDVHNRIVAGQFLDAGDTEGILLGKQIVGGEGVEGDALSLKGVDVGDVVTLELHGQTSPFTVRGIFLTKFIDTDQLAFITHDALDTHFPQFQGKSTSILLRLKTTGIEKNVIDRLRALGTEGTLYSWEDAAGMMKSITKSFLTINVILSFVAILIAAVTIFIVVYIDISNKKREIGILRAIGIKPSVIQWAYILQTVFYAFAGMALGSALFFAVIFPYFVAHPFQLPIVDASLSFTPADLTIRIESIFLVSILAGLIPAVHITRTKLLDAIWGTK